MEMIPLLYCRDLKKALEFYTGILDFRLKYPDEEDDDPVVTLINEGAEIQLTALSGDQKPSVNVYARVENVDAFFARYLSRGLDTSLKPESPVHQGPLNQSWGRREFYVTDPDGNTLRFIDAAPVI